MIVSQPLYAISRKFQDFLRENLDLFLMEYGREFNITELSHMWLLGYVSIDLLNRVIFVLFIFSRSKSNKSVPARQDYWKVRAFDTIPWPPYIPLHKVDA